MQGYQGGKKIQVFSQMVILFSSVFTYLCQYCKVRINFAQKLAVLGKGQVFIDLEDWYWPGVPVLFVVVYPIMQRCLFICLYASFLFLTELRHNAGRARCQFWFFTGVLWLENKWLKYIYWMPRVSLSSLFAVLWMFKSILLSQVGLGQEK